MIYSIATTNKFCGITLLKHLFFGDKEYESCKLKDLFFGDNEYESCKLWFSRCAKVAQSPGLWSQTLKTAFFQRNLKSTEFCQNNANQKANSWKSWKIKDVKASETSALCQRGYG